MKVLFLNAYFQPESIPFTYLEKDIMQAMIDIGYEIEVICPVPTRGLKPDVVAAYARRRDETLHNGKIHVRRFWAPQEGRNPIIRAFRYFWCNIMEYMLGCKYKDIDIIFAVSTPPTQGYLAGKLSKKLRCPFIYSLQDIFPDSLVHAGLTDGGSLLWRIGRALEKRTYNAASKVVVISEDFRKNLLEKEVPDKKISVIRNWADNQSVFPVEREKNRLFDEYGLDRSKFYICYSGNIGHTQNMDMLLNAAKSLMDVPKIGFVLVGDGAAKADVEERIKNESIHNVTMLPFQPYERISEVFSLGDCGLIISKPGVGNNSVPSKTWSIMSAARPVLASFDKGYELDRVIQEANCGICVQAGEAGKLRDAVLKMYKNRKEYEVCGSNGRQYIMENLTREIGTSKWVNVMRKISEK